MTDEANTTASPLPASEPTAVSPAPPAAPAPAFATAEDLAHLTSRVALLEAERPFYESVMGALARADRLESTAPASTPNAAAIGPVVASKPKASPPPFVACVYCGGPLDGTPVCPGCSTPVDA